MKFWRKILLIGAFLIPAQQAAAEHYIIPHAPIGSTVRIQNTVESLQTVQVDDGPIRFLLPFELYTFQATTGNRIIINSGGEVLAWSEVQGVYLAAVKPAKRWVVPVTAFTGITIANDSDVQVEAHLEIFNGSRAVARMSGALRAGGTLATFADMLMRVPLDPDTPYVLIIETSEPIAVIAAQWNVPKDIFISLPVLY